MRCANDDQIREQFLTQNSILRQSSLVSCVFRPWTTSQLFLYPELNQNLRLSTYFTWKICFSNIDCH